MSDKAKPASERRQVCKDCGTEQSINQREFDQECACGGSFADAPASEPQASVTPQHRERAFKFLSGTTLTDKSSIENVASFIACIEAETLAAQAGGREAALRMLEKSWRERNVEYERRFTEASKREQHLTAAQQGGLATAFKVCADELAAALAQPAPAATPPATIKATLIPAGPLKMAPITEDDLAGSPAATEGMLARDPGWEKRAAEWVRERIAELNDSLADLGQP